MSAAKFAKVRRQTLAEQVAEGLLSYIVSEKLQPGDVLPPESKLAEEFGVSRPVVREALKSLAGKGITETINGRGAIVRSADVEPLRFFFERAALLEAKSVVELMEVRRGLESRSAALAAERHKPEDLAKLHDTVLQMRANLHNHDVYAELDVQFHVHLAAASGNSMLHTLIDSMRHAVRDSVMMGLLSRRTHADLELSQQQHEQLLDVVEAGDPQRAAELMERQIDDAIIAMREHSPRPE